MLLRKKSYFPCKYKWECCFCLVCKFLYFLQTKEHVWQPLSCLTRCVLYVNLRSSLPVRSSWSQAVQQSTPLQQHQKAALSLLHNLPPPCHLNSAVYWGFISAGLRTVLPLHLSKEATAAAQHQQDKWEGGRSWLSAHILNMLIDFREKEPCVQRRKTESNQCCQFRI